MFKKIFAILGLLLVFSTAVVFAQESSSTGNADDVTLSVQEDSAEGLSKTAKYIAAAIAVAVACLAGGLAVGKIGAAAMGAISENPEVSGKALPFVGLAEGICLWGMLVAVLILIL